MSVSDTLIFNLTVDITGDKPLSPVYPFTCHQWLLTLNLYILLVTLICSTSPSTTHQLIKNNFTCIIFKSYIVFKAFRSVHLLYSVFWHKISNWWLILVLFHFFSIYLRAVCFLIQSIIALAILTIIIYNNFNLNIYN